MVIFKHEHIPYPLSLPEFGKLHFNVQSDMKDILEHFITVSNITPKVEITSNQRGCTRKPVDSCSCKTLHDYVIQCYIPYITRKLQHD